MDDQGVRVRVPVGARIFSLFHLVQTGSGAHAVLSKDIKNLRLADVRPTFGLTTSRIQVCSVTIFMWRSKLHIIITVINCAGN
jgi:hypothetical protein